MQSWTTFVNASTEMCSRTRERRLSRSKRLRA
jgi:hypothetical protein